MKKLLTLLTSIGLITTASVSVVSCQKQTNNNETEKPTPEPKPEPSPDDPLDPDNPRDPDWGTIGKHTTNYPKQTFNFTLIEKVQETDEIKDKDKDIITETIINAFLDLNQDTTCTKVDFSVNFNTDRSGDPTTITPQSTRIRVVCQGCKATKEKYGLHPGIFNIKINLTI